MVLSESQRDWVAFDGARSSFDVETNTSSGEGKYGVSVRKRSGSFKSTSGRSQRHEKSDPARGTARRPASPPPPPPRRRSSSNQSRPLSPSVELQPVNRREPSPKSINRSDVSPRQTIDGDPSKQQVDHMGFTEKPGTRTIKSGSIPPPRLDVPRPNRITKRSNTASSTGTRETLNESGSSDSQELAGPNHRTGGPAPPARSRSHFNFEPPFNASPRSLDRGRAAMNEIQHGRGRVSTNEAQRGRGRSRSKTRADGGIASTAQSSSRKRASSVPRTISTTRGRSSSRTRPPPSGRDNSRTRARSRSASLTRVTSPATAPSQVRHSRPPPSTSRTRQVMKPHSSSNSVGSGSRNRRQALPDDGSVGSRNDKRIGRDISFGAQNVSSASSIGSRNDKSKKVGLRERLFGDQVAKPGMPGSFAYEIRPRILLAATVYQNTATSLWITTINTNQRGVAKNPTLANKYLKAFSFATEREARESAIANAPPKMVPFGESQSCFVCKGKFALFRRASHCRNCGVCICNNCSAAWPAKMLPATYNLKNEAVLKVCLSCDTLSCAFKNALYEGDYEQAVALYGTGNVNLRTPFPLANKKEEIMHPIHCAVEGGNINILRWLIDDHFCPIKLIRTGGGKKAKRQETDTPILTTKGRSVLTIAMERANIEILRYLVVECGVSIYESVDLRMSLRALETALSALPQSNRQRTETPIAARWDKASFDDISESSSLGNDDTGHLDEIGTVGSRRSRGTRGADSCIICFDQKIDCVATPCGHQVICLQCSTNLSACPVCNNRGEFIKIFRP